MKPQKILISFLLLLNLFFPSYSELDSEADHDDNGEIEFRNEVGGQFEELNRDTDNAGEACSNSGNNHEGKGNLEVEEIAQKEEKHVVKSVRLPRKERRLNLKSPWKC